jgi:hypothetical protein
MTLKELAIEIKVIKENHLAHIEKDMNSMSKQIDKMDSRLWWIFTMIVGGVVGSIIAKALGFI